MKKIVLTILIFTYFCCEVHSECSTIKKNKIDKKEYPECSEVEPCHSFQESSPDIHKTLETGIENTIYVNLEDCLKLALGNNPRIQSAMQDVFASDARLRQIWASYFPQFGWQSGYSRIRQLQLSDVFRENLIYNFWVLGQISASQMLYDFGVTQNKATIRRLDTVGYRIILTGIINDVVYNVKDAYYNLQYSIEALRITEANVRQYESFYKQAKAFYEVGMKPKVDLTIAEVNLSNAKLAQIQAAHSVKIAMAKLNNAIGIPYSTKYSLSDKLRYDKCDIPLGKAIKITQNSRPEFLLSEVKVEQAKQNVKLVKKNWLPEFDIQGQFEVGGRHPDSNYGYTFGAYLNFPTINGMLIKHQLREARSLYSKEQANAINTINNIYLEVQQAFYTLDEKKNKIPVALLSMKQAKENMDLSNGRYQAGVGNPVELNDAQIEYENAQLTYFQILYEYNSARANLEKSIGRNLCTEEVTLKKMIKDKIKKI